MEFNMYVEQREERLGQRTGSSRVKKGGAVGKKEGIEKVDKWGLRIISVISVICKPLYAFH